MASIAEPQRYSSISYVYETQTWTQTHKTALIVAAAAGAIIAVYAAFATVGIQFGSPLVGTIGQNCLYGTIGLGGAILLIDAAIYVVHKVIKEIRKREVKEDLPRINLEEKQYTCLTFHKFGNYQTYFVVNEQKELTCYMFEGECSGRTVLPQQLQASAYAHKQYASVDTIKFDYQDIMTDFVHEDELKKKLGEGEFCCLRLKSKQAGLFFGFFLHIKGEIQTFATKGEDERNRIKTEYRQKGYKENEQIVAPRTAGTRGLETTHLSMRVKNDEITEYSPKLGTLNSYEYYVVVTHEGKTRYYVHYRTYKNCPPRILYTKGDLDGLLSGLQAEAAQSREIMTERTDLRDEKNGMYLLKKHAEEYGKTLTKKLRRNCYCVVTLKKGLEENACVTGMIVNDVNTNGFDYYTQQRFAELPQAYRESLVKSEYLKKEFILSDEIFE